MKTLIKNQSSSRNARKKGQKIPSIAVLSSWMIVLVSWYPTMQVQPTTRNFVNAFVTSPRSRLHRHYPHQNQCSQQHQKLKQQHHQLSRLLQHQQSQREYQHDQTSSVVVLQMARNPKSKLTSKGPRFTQQVHVTNPNPFSNENGDEDSSNASARRKVPLSELYQDPTIFGYNDDDDDNNRRNENQQQQRSRRRLPGQFNNNNGNTPQPWQSNKSIDDLESIMMKRWGPLADSKQGSTSPKASTRGRTSNTKLVGKRANDLSDGEDDDEDEKTPTGLQARKPVYDPWQKERDSIDESLQNDKGNDSFPTGRPKPNKRSMTSSSTSTTLLQFPDEDYYDSDDEGYEYDYDNSRNRNSNSNPNYKDDSNRRSTSKLNLAHVIAPEPAAGGYFFNPEAAETPTSKDMRNKQKGTVVSSNKKNAIRGNEQVSDSNMTSKSKNKEDVVLDGESVKPKKRVALQPSAPLLDEHNKPMLLTVTQAKREFERTLKPKDRRNRGNFQQVELNDWNEEQEDAPIVTANRNSHQASWPTVGITSSLLIQNLKDMKCCTPLSVQEKACPPILTGNDVVVGTYTGSGKTLAFLTPLIQRQLWDMDTASVENDDNIDDDDDTSSDEKISNSGNNNHSGLVTMIVAPGRELASQIASVARELLKGTGLNVQLAIGGTTFTRNLQQIRKRKPSIVVGTPGRIAELVVGKPGEKRGRLNVASLQSLVLDEFDALIEYKPHREPTRAIMATLQRRHRDSLQSILCSATASDVMDSSPIVQEFLRPGYVEAFADPDDVLVTKADGTTSTVPRVSRTVIHGVVHIPHRRLALDTIRRILHTEPIPQQILIFVDTARKVDVVIDKLADMGMIAAPLHGGAGSDKMDRAEVSKALRDGNVGIVVATELAARGLDAPLLTHVINLDLPTDASHYAHRAGRCGRGGRPGVVINITTSTNERKVPKRFADALGIDLYTVEPRKGTLAIVDPKSQTIV